MTSIGETLRRERLRRNLGLDQISRELKINSKFLEAIETDQFEKLPGQIFARNFVRQYARHLGLDEEEMGAEIQRLLAPPPEQGHSTEAPKQLAAPIQVPKVESWETVGDRRFSWGSPLPALAMFVGVIVICSLVYAWYQKPRRPAQAQTPTPAVQQQMAQAAPPQPPPSAPVTETTPAGQPKQPETSASLPVVPTPSPLTAPAVAKPAPAETAAPDPNATVHVQITASEASWVLVRGDGKYIFSGTLDPNQTRSVEAVHGIELRLGNAGGVTVTLNGNPIGPVGPKGQVRTIQLTSGGFQIVAPPKPPPLSDPR